LLIEKRENRNIANTQYHFRRTTISGLKLPVISEAHNIYGIEEPNYVLK
jgi:hypothetical protein